MATSGQFIEASRGIQRRAATQEPLVMSRTDKLQPSRTIVLVGLMGAGKTNIGRRLAQRLGIAFVDADDEIEKAAGCSIADIFAVYGEAVFRDGERRVIARLLEAPPHVLATGGGAFMDDTVRAKVREKGVSVWLRVDLDTLVHRVARKSDERPLLAGKDPREVLASLMESRYPIYAEADITIDSGRESPDATVGQVIAALKQRFAALEAAS
jgi:shikimate kinase